MDVFITLWGMIYDYFTETELWFNILSKTIKIIIILLGTMIVIRLSKVMLQKAFNVRLKSPLRLTEQREMTLYRLLENVLTYVIYFIALVMILMEFDIDVKGLIAGAGVIGLAIGFGAQNLVKDIITGFFIIFERQFSVNDYVKINGLEGYVEEIGLRITKIKSWTGEQYIFPNSSINQVTNYSVHDSVAVVDVAIPYEEKIEEAETIIKQLLEEIADQYDIMVDKPIYLGVQELSSSEVVLRVMSEVKPMTHWGMGRELRKLIKTRLEERGIDVPLPRIVMFNKPEIEAK